GAHLQQCPRRWIHRGFPQRLGVHLAEALVAVDRYTPSAGRDEVVDQFVEVGGGRHVPVRPGRRRGRGRIGRHRHRNDVVDALDRGRTVALFAAGRLRLAFGISRGVGGGGGGGRANRDWPGEHIPDVAVGRRERAELARGHEVEI